MATGIDLEHFLPYRLSRLSNMISRGIAAAYRDSMGLSVAEWRVLAVVARFPGSSASELVRRTAMDKVAIHRAVRSLTQRELLHRREHSDDRRQRQLTLTRRGQSLHDQVAPRALDYQRRLLAGLEAAEVRRLQALLDKLENAAESLNHEPREQPPPGSGERR